jgi:hypothetical protein
MCLTLCCSISIGYVFILLWQVVQAEDKLIMLSYVISPTPSLDTVHLYK